MKVPNIGISVRLIGKKFKQVINGNGPCNHKRLSHHIKVHNEGKWVREAALAFSKNQQKNNASLLTR
jgi:hypothetical protein